MLHTRATGFCLVVVLAAVMSGCVSVSTSTCSAKDTTNQTSPAAAASATVNDSWPADWFFGDPNQRAQQDQLLGKPAPALELSDWMNGEVTAKDRQGRIVIVDFWATWCGPCIASIPHNNEMYEKYKDQGVILIGVCGSQGGQEKMPEIVKSKGIEYPVARDATLRSAEAWRVMWWPTYAVVDRHGVLRAIGLKPDAVDKVVDKLLKEQPFKASTVASMTEAREHAR